jgi:hypothetical protein
VRRIKEQGAPRGHDGAVLTVRFRLPRLPFFRYKLPEKFGSDLRGLGPVHVCPCGSQVFNIMASFEDYELVWYFLDGTCASCGNIVTVPCPVDKDEAQSI